MWTTLDPLSGGRMSRKRLNRSINQHPYDLHPYDDRKLTIFFLPVSTPLTVRYDSLWSALFLKRTEFTVNTG